MSTREDNAREPEGELAIRTLAMPANANPNGDIFGGWVVSHMDLAGASAAVAYCNKRITTVAIDSMIFKSPVKVGDFICCYAKIIDIGCTSMRVKVETWAIGALDEKHRLVTEGEFVFVSIDDNGRPIPIEN